MGLFDRFKKKEEEKTNANETINVKEYFKDISLTKEDEEYILKGNFIPTKHFSNIAFQVLCFHGSGGEMFGTPLNVFNFNDVGPDSPRNFILRFSDSFHFDPSTLPDNIVLEDDLKHGFMSGMDIKYFMFIVVDNPDNNINGNTFYAYNQIGNCSFLLEEVL